MKQSITNSRQEKCIKCGKYIIYVGVSGDFLPEMCDCDKERCPHCGKKLKS